MRNHKIAMFTMLLALTMVLFLACRPVTEEPTEQTNVVIDNSATVQEEPGEQDTDTEDEGIPHGAERVGIVYMDPIHMMTVFIKNGDWTYFKNPDSGVVYFHNENDDSGTNLISISAYVSDEDALEVFEKWWNMMMESYKDRGFEIETKELETIEINGGYTAYHHQYDLIEEGEILHCTNTCWNADGMMYTCVSSSDDECNEEVLTALHDIFDSFERM